MRQSGSCRLRPFRESDYAALAALKTAVLPSDPIVADRLRRLDEERPASRLLSRAVAVRGDYLAGCAELARDGTACHPDQAILDLNVQPDHRRLGIGQTLWHQAVSAAQEAGVTRLKIWLRDLWSDGIEFAARRGFAESMREQILSLNLLSFDFRQFQSRLEKVLASGIRICSIASLDDTEWPRALWKLENLIEQDVPRSEAFTPMEWTEWRACRLESPHFLPRQCFVARAGAEYAGMTMLWPSCSSHLDTGLTGVVRDHRRRGIALALKIEALRSAQEAGYSEIRTDNAAANIGMQSINRRLGFLPTGAWIECTAIAPFQQSPPLRVFFGE